jgi:hypothetical protein
MFSVIFLPATLIASIWGMNVGGIPFGENPNGFWVVAALIAASFVLVAMFLFRFRFGKPALAGNVTFPRAGVDQIPKSSSARVPAS